MCRMFLEKKDIKRTGPFPCPCCHKLLRVSERKRPKYLTGLVAIAAGFFSIAVQRAHGARGVRDAGLLTGAFMVIFELAHKYLFAKVEIVPAEDT